MGVGKRSWRSPEKPKIMLSNPKEKSWQLWKQQGRRARRHRKSNGTQYALDVTSSSVIIPTGKMVLKIHIMRSQAQNALGS
jgi:hypothetical protein